MFDNTIKTEWLADDPRKMRLLDDINFIDPSGKEWHAPAGSIVDGASIPRFFWRVIGSPFVGRYRRATVIHDVYCVTRSEPHEAVHNMFLEAMLDDGVSGIKANLMFDAVFNHGPKWDKDGKDLTICNNDPSYTDPSDEDDFFV